MANFDDIIHKNTPELIAYLDANYYATLTELCSHASRKANTLKAKEKEEQLHVYYNLVTRLTDKVKNYIKWNREILGPYIQKLSEKEATSHDCSNCSGKCHLEHSSQMPILRNLHSDIYQVLYNLRLPEFTHYSDLETNIWEEYKSLVTDVQLIDNTISELFELEAKVLIPNIEKAQKNINVLS